MTPIQGRIGNQRWWQVEIVARFAHDAIRVAEQTALEQGFSFDGDIEVCSVGKAITEDGE
jgi:hypothetical protein